MASRRRVEDVTPDRRSPRQLIVRWLGPFVGLAAVAALVVVLNPNEVWRALSRFDVRLLPAVVVLNVAVLVVQGARWHVLLRDAGVRLRVRDSVLLNIAGQTITALVPLGDLTRAAFAAEAGRRDFGTVAATVTVQELTYTLCLVLLAMPELLRLRLGIPIVALSAAGMAAVVVVLTVSPVFCVVHRLVARIPLLNRLLPAIDELQHETAALLHRPRTLVWSVADLGRGAVAITSFWLVVWGLAPGTLDPGEAALAFTVSVIGGALSLLPGGFGANEASVAGILFVLGVPAGAAGAAALIQRVVTSGTALGFGLVAYAIVRRRLDLGGLFELTARPQRRAA